jgi:protein involved in polysaccharide export with SLBB domain
MTMHDRRRNRRGLCGRASLLLVVFLSGCTSVPGNRLTLFPEGHRLIEPAKSFRNAVTLAPPVPREMDRQPLPPYVVEPGDVVLVQPAEVDSPVRLPGDQAVMPDGTISLGRYGPLGVAGLTLPQIEGEVRSRIEAQAPGKEIGAITVRVVSRTSKVFYVLGEVNAPGAFPLNGRETALDGLVAAGGLTDRASRRKIILSRPSRPGGCRVVLPVCYNEIVQLGDTSTNYQLAPGDQIYVATRSLWEELFHFLPSCCPTQSPQVPCPSPAAVEESEAALPLPSRPRLRSVPPLVVPPATRKK